jgi:hypothetical protein
LDKLVAWTADEILPGRQDVLGACGVFSLQEPFMKMLLLAPALVLVALLAIPVLGGDKPEGFRPNGPEPVDAKDVIHSIYPVGSRIKDPDSLEEFRSSDNLPRVIDPKNPIGEQDKVSVVLNLPAAGRKGSREGLSISIVNRTEHRAAFSAMDSFLYIVQEAKDEKGEWHSLQRRTPATGPRDCAVGAHQVFLEPAEYWTVAAPRFVGTFRTKLRFRLDMGSKGGKIAGGGGRVIYTPEFDGSVNPEQLDNRPVQ